MTSKIQVIGRRGNLWRKEENKNAGRKIMCILILSSSLNINE